MPWNVGYKSFNKSFPVLFRAPPPVVLLSLRIPDRSHNAGPLMNTMSRPRVLLAEDHAETAERLRKLLRVDFDVIEWVEDGRALVDAAARLSPDVTVADSAMPRLDGIAAATVMRRNDPNARIVLVTVHSDLMLVEAGLAAGALGYVLKDTAGDDLVAAVHAALDGRRYVSRALGDVPDDPTNDAKRRPV